MKPLKEMSENKDVVEDLKILMGKALLEMKTLVDQDVTRRTDFVAVAALFLQGLMSMAAELAERSWQGGGSQLYSKVEEDAKEGRRRALERLAAQQGQMSYSTLTIDPNDKETAMNYLGEYLSVAFLKGLNELPRPLQNLEVLLGALEVLLTNLLHQKVSNPHQLLGDFCEHVHQALSEVSLRGRSSEDGRSETLH